MKIRVLVVLAVLLLAGPAFAQKVFVDFDAKYDMDSVKTFAWKSTSDTSLENDDPLMHSRIVNAIEHYISMSGITEVRSDPDVYVTYHASSKENLSLNTSSFGYGYPGSWHYGGYDGMYGGYGGMYGGGISTSTTTVSTYETGTLVVDVWDAKTNELVWRGIADNITVSDNPAKMEKKIDTALKKIVSKSQKARAREAKNAAKAKG